MDQTIGNLSEKYLTKVLRDDPRSDHGGIDYTGETLAEYIELAGLSKECSITKLHEALMAAGIQSPFQPLIITVEVTVSRGFEIALTDEAYDALGHGDVEIDDLDPDFKLEDAYAETEYDRNAFRDYDYGIQDCEGRVIVPFDD